MNLCRIISYNIPKLFVKNSIVASILPQRNTFIVKRKFPPPLSRLRAVRKRILKRRHFVYQTVEDTDLTEPPDLKIVLTTFVEGVGDVGDVISLIPQYARDHFLLPQKAAYATPENVEKYATLKKTRPERARYSSIYAGMTMRNLSRHVIPVFMNPEVPWTIEKNHIHYAFRSEDFFVPEDCIDLPSHSIVGPDRDKEGRDFAVYVTINNTEKFPVRCRLFHIKPGFETVKLSEEHYLDKNEPIIPEQRELLEDMPMPEIIKDSSANISLVEKYRIQYIKSDNIMSTSTYFMFLLVASSCFLAIKGETIFEVCEPVLKSVRSAFMASRGELPEKFDKMLENAGCYKEDPKSPEEMIEMLKGLAMEMESYSEEEQMEMMMEMKEKAPALEESMANELGEVDGETCFRQIHELVVYVMEKLGFS